MHNRIIKQIALAITGIIVICSLGLVSYNAKADNPNSNYDPSEDYNPNTNYVAESTDGGPNGPEIDGIPRSEANYGVEANAYYNLLNDFGIKTPSAAAPTTNTNNNLNNITQTGHGTRSNALWRHGIPREFGPQVAWISKYQHTGYGKDYYTRNVVWPGLNRSDDNQYGMNITPLYYNRSKYLDDSGTNEGPMVAYNPHFNRRRDGAFRIISGNNSVDDDLNEAEYEADLKENTNYSGYNTGDSTPPYNQIAFDLIKFRDRNHFNMWRANPYWKNEHLWWRYKFLGTYIRTVYHTWNSLLYAQHHIFKYADGQHANFNNLRRSHNKVQTIQHEAHIICQDFTKNVKKPHLFSHKYIAHPSFVTKMVYPFLTHLSKWHKSYVEQGLYNHNKYGRIVKMYNNVKHLRGYLGTMIQLSCHKNSPILSRKLFITGLIGDTKNGLDLFGKGLEAKGYNLVSEIETGLDTLRSVHKSKTHRLFHYLWHKFPHAFYVGGKSDNF